MTEWVLVAAYLLGLAQGLFFGWWVWRRANLVYDRETPEAPAGKHDGTT